MELYKRFNGLLLLAICIISCKPQAFYEAPLGLSKIGFTETAGTMTVDPATFVNEPGQVSFPIELSLSSEASNTFTVKLNSDVEAAQSAVASLSISNAMALPADLYLMPQNVEFRFGIKKIKFNVIISRTTIEQNFGKKLAVGITLSNSTKGNEIDNTNKTIVAFLNTEDVITSADIHLLSLKDAGPLFIPTSLNSSKDANTLNIPLQIDLSGTVGKGFGVELAYDAATINQMSASNSLSGAELLPESFVSFTANPSIAVNAASTIVNLSVNFADLNLAANYQKKYAFAVTLTSTERYQINPAKKTVVVMIDPLNLVDDISFLMKNYKRPFVASAIEPVAKRWGKLADWTTNTEVNKFKTTTLYGSWDANNSTNIALEAFSPDRPNITNGKIYQVVTLQPGTYRFVSTLRSGSNNANSPAYAAVISGNVVMPNVNLIPNAGVALGFIKLTGTAGDHTVTFTLNQTTAVTLGYSATIVQNNSYNIQEVKLLHVF